MLEQIDLRLREIEETNTNLKKLLEEVKAQAIELERLAKI